MQGKENINEEWCSLNPKAFSLSKILLLFLGLILCLKRVIESPSKLLLKNPDVGCPEFK